MELATQQKREKAKKLGMYDMVAVAVMAALVFVATRFSIPITMPFFTAMIGLGNVFCLLSALLLGPLRGGLAAGLGSCLFDLLDPVFITSAPFTLVFKFLMAFVCGLIAYSGGRKAQHYGMNLLAAAAGNIAYIVLHLSKVFFTSIFIYQTELATAFLSVGQNFLVSAVNAVLAVVISTLLALPLRQALKQAKFYEKMGL